ncbi:MAG TPA: formate dehydrogenase subunit gamma [Bryobacteraceae bacterium]|nr:formate dehydrogenase subunit gamma [Bryobacteraceae bacterium]
MKKPIERFTFAERASHWISALCFLYAAFTGLALWSPRLFWLSGVFGGGETVRAWHPWGGLFFFLALGVMFRRWFRQMYLDTDDQTWLAKSHLYAQNMEVDVPESGRFNAGQKMMFWLQSASAVFLLLSGIVIWFPEVAPRSLRLIAVLLHPVCAAVSMGGIMVHFYMSTFAVPGSLDAMIHGNVSEGWARSHHGKWYREVRQR